MKAQRLLEKMGDISPEYVEEAAPVKRRPARLPSDHTLPHNKDRSSKTPLM